MRAGQPRQDHVARHQRLFRRRRNSAHAEERGVVALVHDAAVVEVRVLFVRDDGDAQHRRILERAAHQLRVVDRLAVVAHSDAAGRAQIGKLGQRLALQPLAHRADRIDAAGAVARRFGDDHLGHGALVVRRNGVRHRADRGVAARHRGPRAGGDRLLVLLPRLAQMRVQVDEPGSDDETGGVDRVDVRLDLLVDARDRAVLDQDVELGVEVLAGIDDAAVCDEEVHGFEISNVEC